MKSIIFISHRSADKEIADILVDFFCGTGIPRESIFCSSLPGNDINEKISEEVKDAIKRSKINIAILSRDYYQSAYCLNEAGVLWYRDDATVIPIALLEINEDCMYGFLNSEYKIRRLDCTMDVSYIYDAVREVVSAGQSTIRVINYEIQKLHERYIQFCNGREPQTISLPPMDISNITTDDEKVVLYYILKYKVRKVFKGTLLEWLCENEIYGINVDNAFDLLASFDGGTASNGTLELGIEMFRKWSSAAETLLPQLGCSIAEHTKYSAETLNFLWNSETLNKTVKLFVAYISDERMKTLGTRWMANMQVENIKEWEKKNSLSSELSENYGTCLEFFIQHDLVYESSWTDHGNVRQYTLCSSLQKYLFEPSDAFAGELRDIKQEYLF